MHGSDLDELHTCLICIDQSEVDGQQNPKENQQNSLNKFKKVFLCHWMDNILVKSIIYKMRV